ncbi:DUF3993 domain-containing protein [Rossellomorea aquimaris]|uniref:DUF3993 domain-containing protein n=1 Tax=Rossellomorea aquimaris TaxID=189382 RepID=UPI001CD3595F|nr:DUF3993 domain-containing protein [Rossellomorea aquimaris]MCA1056614.1 DUF3993 domain-containing protein [Rossellomorea aquimaris]
MERRRMLLLFIIIGMVSAACAQVNRTQASTFNDDQALNLVKQAFHAQVSLSERPQAMEGIKKQLQAYFTDELASSFIKENVVEVEGGYQSFGSDFAPYYIPFFTFDSVTEVEYLNGKWYIWEVRSGEVEGPVSTERGVDAVVLSKVKGEWKVSSITSELPQTLLEPKE